MLQISQEEMHKLIEEFLDETAIGYRTIETYRVYLGYFSDFLDDKAIEPQEVTGTQVKRWLERQRWSDNTIRIAHVAIRSFIRHTYGEEHPFLRMKVRRVEDSPQRTLTEDQVRQLLNSIDVSGSTGIRNKAMLLLMLDTGLRASEVCSLAISKLNLEERSLRVKIKGGGWGTGVFTEYTKGWLEEWIKARENVAHSRVQNVFVSVKGIKPGTAITRDGLRSIFRKLGQRAGLGLISPHDMRRTFATLAIRNGAPTRLVQVAGRWKNIREVERYTRAIKAEDIAPYSPIGKMLDNKPSDEETT
jgi:site-specific recombinase XerD